MCAKGLKTNFRRRKKRRRRRRRVVGGPGFKKMRVDS
jgi:hypothetical protein